MYPPIRDDLDQKKGIFHVFILFKNKGGIKLQVKKLYYI